jgi:hypothetical protein
MNNDIPALVGKMQGDFPTKTLGCAGDQNCPIYHCFHML